MRFPDISKKIDPSPRYKWEVMAIVMIGTLMAALDSSIVNVSIPKIQADFGVNIDDVEWVLTGYMIAFATLMPLTAWLRDRIGYKALYLSSLFVFTLGSLLCGAAVNLQTLILARVIQALGGGAITPTGMAMISEVFPPRERGKAMGIWGMGVIMGPAFGPTLGGYLTETLGWRSIFLVNLPIGIFCFFLAVRLLIKDKPHKSTHRPFDLWGFIFLSVFLVSFLLALSKGEREGWTSVYITSCFITSVLSFIGFLLVESGISYGIIDIKLFKYPVFAICSFISAIRSVALFGGVFLLPLFLQQQMGFDEIQSGLILMPGAILIAILMPFTGKLSDRIGPRILSIAGLVCIAVFMFMYKDLSLSMSVFDIILPTMVRGVGMAFLMAPVMAAALNSIPQHKTGMASSMLNIVQQVGGSIGIALLGAVLSHRMPFHINVLGSALDMRSPAVREMTGKMFYHAHSLGYPAGISKLIANNMTLKYIAKYCMVLSFQDAFIAGGLMVVIAIIPAFLLPGHKAHNAMHEKTQKGTIEEIASMD